MFTQWEIFVIYVIQINYSTSPVNDAPLSHWCSFMESQLNPSLDHKHQFFLSNSNRSSMKKAVICGVSYKGIESDELEGCINDAKCMKYLLITKFKFKDSNILMLTGT